MSRAQVSLWTLTTAAVLAAGGTAQALAAPASTAADITVAAGLLLLTISGLLLCRVLRHLLRDSAPAAPWSRREGPAGQGPGRRCRQRADGGLHQRWRGGAA
ncbi:hypothetical protein [Streptomyces sp. NPDC101165]|uniref:hypothetical protein n=1 Tax=Streptomyces sp. NPDC101165 TaxID=3366119 RepID=UPI0037FF5C94